MIACRFVQISHRIHVCFSMYFQFGRDAFWSCGQHQKTTQGKADIHTRLSHTRLSQKVYSENCMLRPPLNTKLFPVHGSSGLKRPNWNIFIFIFQKILFFSFFGAFFFIMISPHRGIKIPHQWYQSTFEVPLFNFTRPCN